MKTTALKPVETWVVISVGARVDIYAPPECYPEGTTLPQVLRQPFVGRIRRFVRQHDDAGWVVEVEHETRCNAVLCVCRPTLHYHRGPNEEDA